MEVNKIIIKIHQTIPKSSNTTPSILYPYSTLAAIQPIYFPHYYWMKALSWRAV